MSKRSHKHATQPQPNRTMIFLIGFIVLSLVSAGIVYALVADDDENSPQSAAEISTEPQLISPDEYNESLINEDHLLVDVRTPEEFATGHISGAVNISLQELEQRISEIPTDKPVVLYCRSGNRSAQAAEFLSDAGYNQLYDLGGIQTWQSEGYPVE